MPQIDPSHVLTSPMMVDFFDVNRRQEVVSVQGKSSFALLTFPKVAGVVAPGPRNRLKRDEDSTTQEKSILVTTRFMLRGATRDATGNYQPDIVSWAGNSYLVTEPRDNSRYGKGFIKTICEMTDFQPQAPVAGSAFIPSGTGSVQLLKLKSYIPTIVSATVVTLPSTIDPNSMLFFRNGQLNVLPGDFTAQIVNGVLQITLLTPIGIGDFIVVFA